MNPQQASEEAALREIRTTYPTLDAWQSRAARMPPEEPERGSALASDDAIFEWHPISESVRLSLAVAGEHLRLARTSIEAGQLYPSAHFTTIRAALVGAAQAVWILAPSEPRTRQERGLILLSEMYDQVFKYYGDLRSTPLTELERSELANQIEWSSTRRAQVSEVRQSRQRLNQTEMIRWALVHRFPDEERRAAGIQLWRQMSGDAHVLGWSLFQRSVFGHSDRATGIGVGAASGSIEKIAQAFLCSYLLLKKGWSLFDRRCEHSG